MSACHLLVVLTGAPRPFKFCGAHFAFALAVIFVAFSTLLARRRLGASLDGLCVAGAPGKLGLLIWTRHALYKRFQFVDPPTTLRFWMGVGLTALVLETLTPNSPGDVLYLSTEGMYGIPMMGRLGFPPPSPARWRRWPAPAWGLLWA